MYHVLSLLKDTGVSYNLYKCSFFTDHVDYLGNIIRAGKLHAVEKTTEAIAGLKEPSTITKMKSFLALCNVFRRFVPNVSRIATPLNAKLYKL